MNKELFKELGEDELSRLSAAIWNFAEALTNSEEFKNYETTFSVLSRDQAAQQQLQTFRQKQQEINQLYRQNGDRNKALAELNKIQSSLLKYPTIADHTNAQDAVMTMCTEAGTLLSRKIGLDYASVCGPSCCG